MASGGGNAPNPNTVPILPAATSTMCAYPIGKVRKDMNSQEYSNYRYEWYLFNTVWSYNYTISTLNGQGATYDYWAYKTNHDRNAYINGQAAHVAFYSNVPAAQFASIQGD
jgi:hypothetical protein